MAKRKPKVTDNTDWEAFEEGINPVSDVESPLTAVLYGRSGTGKTHLSSTFPKPLLLLDVRERGTKTISNVDGVDVRNVVHWSGIEQGYWFLRKAKHKYKTVVIDQCSSMQDLCMDGVREEDGKDPDDLITKAMWGSISGKMKQWLLAYRDLQERGMNVCFIAHERADASDEAEDQIDPSVGPRVMPSVSSFLNGLVDVIGNTFIRERFKNVDGKRTRFIDYSLRIGAHGYYTTKVRHPVGVDTPSTLVNPTYNDIIAVVEGRYLSKAKKVVKRNAKA